MLADEREREEFARSVQAGRAQTRAQADYRKTMQSESAGLHLEPDDGKDERPTYEVWPFSFPQHRTEKLADWESRERTKMLASEEAGIVQRMNERRDAFWQRQERGQRVGQAPGPPRGPWLLVDDEISGWP